MKKLTTDEFKQIVFSMYKDEYTVVGEYNGFVKSIDIFHNKCGKTYTYTSAGRFINGTSKCPYCNSDQHVTLNTDIFKYRVSQLVGDEYTVIGEYTKANEPIKIRHNKCSCKNSVYEYVVTPHHFLMGSRCPYDSHQQEYTIEDFRNILSEKLPTYRCLGTEYINSKTKIDVMCDKGHVFKISLDAIKNNRKCNICSNTIITPGINDLNTTHPHITQYLVNKDDGTKYAFYTKTKLPFKCPYCGNIVEKMPSCVLRNNHEFICVCNDGVSYPEKFMSNILNQLNIQYKYQLSSHDFKWCGKYRYDFYLCAKNTVLETHGKQHYGTNFFTDSKIISDTDIKKEHLAKQNGVKYVAIDMRYSTLEYCKQSILQSDFFQQYDLSIIDWDMADIFACKSLLAKIANDWCNGETNIKKLATKYKIHTATIYKYLEKANELHLCSFNKDEYIHLSRKTSYVYTNNIIVKSVETGIVYKSMAEAKRLTGAYLTKDIIGNPNKKSANQHWIYA